MSHRAPPVAKPAKPPPAAASPTPTKRPPDRRPPDDAMHWLIHGPDGPPVQRKPVDAGYGDLIDAARAQQVAARGVADARAPLPHLARIQQAFGRHDVSHARAAVGGRAGEAAQQLGARGYAIGHRVAFRQQPDVRLAAHEAAHVVQQRAGLHLDTGLGQAGDVHERHADAVAEAVVAGRSAEPLLDRYQPAAPQGACACARGCAVQRDHDPAADATEVAAELATLRADKVAELDEIETGTGRYLHLDAAKLPAARARASRELAMLQSTTPQTFEELAALEERVQRAGADEAFAATALAAQSPTAPDALLSGSLSWGFPSLWADRLAATMKSPIDPAQAGRSTRDAWTWFLAIGKQVPPYLVMHGLPVDFDRAYDLDHFTLTPQLASLPGNSPLHQLGAAMISYQDAFAREQLAIRYTAAIAGLVSGVRDGDTQLDTALFPQYAKERGTPPTLADVMRDPPKNPLAAGEVNPYEFEHQTFSVLFGLGMLERLRAGVQAHTQYTRIEAEADALLQARSGLARIALAHQWADEHGYPGFVRDTIVRSIKQSWPHIVKDALVDTGKFIIIQWIPIVDVLYDAYLVGKGAYHAVDAAWSLVGAENVARQATTIVGLQRAAARLTLAESTEALQLVAATLEVFGSWQAMRGAMKQTAAALGDEAAADAGQAAKRAAKSTVAGAERAAAKEVAIAGEQHALPIVKRLGQLVFWMCSKNCGEIVVKLRRLLAYLNKTGSDTFAQDPVAKLLEKAMKLESRLARLSERDAGEQLATLRQAVDELATKHPDIAKNLPDIESLTAGEPDLFPNLEPRRLGQELALARKLGVTPMRATDPGFDHLVNQGTIKFVITEDGQLLVMPKHVGGQELSHPVLSGGRPVLAAGEADIASASGKRLGTTLKMHSGHFKPNTATRSLALAAFKTIGVEFP